MAPVTDYAEILPGVQACVADSLALDEDEVRLEALLIPELGADSLDFIDILFLLEKRFSVKLREGELGFLSRLGGSEFGQDRDQPLGPEEVAQLEPWLPAISGKEEVTAGQIFALISVETLCIMVARRLAAQEG